MKKLFYMMMLPAILLGAQRKVLIEVYTATWCHYCPYSSYALDTLEMNYGDSIVVIKYHSSSSDPFYTQYAAQRANYYPDFSGYPTAYFDGVSRVEGGWDGVYSDYENAFLTRIDSTSPASIQLGINYNSNLREGKAIINIHSETKLPDHTYLRCAIVEDSIFYSWQTRNVLRYVLRKMLPDAQGIPLSLASGETYQDTVDFNIDTSWIEPYVYFVAFLQDDSTREVLQANMIRIPVDYGKLVLLESRFSDSIGNNNERLEPGDSGIFYFTITDVKPYQTAHGVDINIQSDDPYISIETPSIHYDSITVSDTVTFSTKVQCTGGDTRFINLFFEMTSDSGKFYSMDTLHIKVGFDSLLVWDGTQVKNLRNYVLPYLDSLGIHYDFQSQIDSGLPRLQNAYKYLMYYSGNTSPDSETIQLLKDFMDMNVNTFITGQNIASASDSTFLSSYLKVRYLYDTTTDLLVKGTGNLFNPEDTVFLTGSGSAMNQSSKDVIEPLQDAIPVFYYRQFNQSDTDTTAAVAYDDGAKKVVFFAFGYEGMGTLKTGKKEVLRRVLNYLGYSISSIEEEKGNGNDFYPKTILSTTMKLSVPFKDNTVCNIYNLQGRLLLKKRVENGFLTLPEHIKNGVYFIEARDKNPRRIKVLLYK